MHDSGGEQAGWLFRVASKPSAGGGHVGRCRALGSVISESLPVTFVLDADGTGWRESLGTEGFAILTPDGPFEGRSWNGVLIDTYDLTEDEFARFRALVCPLVALVDTVTPRCGFDLVINSAPGLEGDQLEGMPALLGSRYALIDRKFGAPNALRGSASVSKIVVSFGLVDDGNYCGRTLEALSRLRLNVQAEIFVLIGSQCPNLEGLRKSASESRHRVEVRVDEFDMAGALLGADIVIGAGGVSLLERMAMGIPSLSIAIAENQNDIVGGAASAGATVAVEADATENLADYLSILQAFIDDEPFRDDMARRARRLVDGRGAERVGAALVAMSRQCTETTASERPNVE